MGGLSAIAQISLFLAFCVVLLLIFKSIEKIMGSRKNSNGHLTMQNLLDSEERVKAGMRVDITVLLVEKVTNPIVAEIRGLREDLANRRRYTDPK